MSPSPERLRRPWLSTALWFVAVVLMFAAASYQRLTGPTYELRGEFDVGGEVFEYELIRSEYSTTDAAVVIPDPGEGVRGRLVFKRYPTDDPWSATPMESVQGELVGLLPAQPAAGHLEYVIELETPEGVKRIPGEETVLIRFKDPVPAWVLVPHIFCMFFALLVGVRTGLGALFHPVGLRKLMWTTLGLMTLGGMILGPVVQKYSFGAFWTGWPLGYDLTDNKTLIMWVVWVGVALVLWKRRNPRDPWVRRSIVAAAVVMMVVYVIPHSAQGSQLDYEALEIRQSRERSP